MFAHFTRFVLFRIPIRKKFSRRDFHEDSPNFPPSLSPFLWRLYLRSTEKKKKVERQSVCSCVLSLSSLSSLFSLSLSLSLSLFSLSLSLSPPRRPWYKWMFQSTRLQDQITKPDYKFPVPPFTLLLLKVFQIQLDSIKEIVFLIFCQSFVFGIWRSQCSFVKKLLSFKWIWFILFIWGIPSIMLCWMNRSHIWARRCGGIGWTGKRWIMLCIINNDFKWNTMWEKCCCHIYRAFDIGRILVLS